VSIINTKLALIEIHSSATYASMKTDKN